MRININKTETTFDIMSLSEDGAQKLCALIGGVIPLGGDLFHLWARLDKELSPRKYKLVSYKGQVPEVRRIEEEDDAIED